MGPLSWHLSDLKEQKATQTGKVAQSHCLMLSAMLMMQKDDSWPSPDAGTVLVDFPVSILWFHWTFVKYLGGGIQYGNRKQASNLIPSLFKAL